MESNVNTSLKLFFPVWMKFIPKITADSWVNFSLWFTIMYLPHYNFLCAIEELWKVVFQANLEILKRKTFLKKISNIVNQFWQGRCWTALVGTLIGQLSLPSVPWKLFDNTHYIHMSVCSDRGWIIDMKPFFFAFFVAEFLTVHCDLKIYTNRTTFPTITGAPFRWGFNIDRTILSGDQSGKLCLKNVDKCMDEGTQRPENFARETEKNTWARRIIAKRFVKI